VRWFWALVKTVYIPYISIATSTIPVRCNGLINNKLLSKEKLNLVIIRFFWTGGIATSVFSFLENSWHIVPSCWTLIYPTQLHLSDNQPTNPIARYGARPQCRHSFNNPFHKKVILCCNSFEIIEYVLTNLKSNMM
jgi:hypothetical protein